MTKRNTMQKEIILSSLCSMCTHPTAAMLYDEVHRVHPRISRSTVYRVLAQMAEDGTVLRLGFAGGDDRYDGNISHHSHIRCRICGRVDDLHHFEMEQPRESAGYLVEHCTIAYTGICPLCQSVVGDE